MKARSLTRLGNVDPALAVSLLVGLLFCLHGIQWGRVEPWNPDQMAYVQVFSEGRPPLHPRDFLRPPFHTYFHYIFSHVPVYLLKILLGWEPLTWRIANLLVSRLLTVFLFLGCIYLTYVIVKRAFGTFAARASSLILATSAGFIAFAHFLTTDVPLAFWMLLSFLFAQNVALRSHRTGDYAAAGFLAGIATAVKYNGVAVAVAIVAAHALSFRHLSWKRMLLNKQLVIGLLMVPVGFLVANPFAILDYENFIADFMYNNLTAPVYLGETGSTNYLNVGALVAQVVGVPGLLLCIAALLFAVWQLFRLPRASKEFKSVVLAFSVLLPYYLVMGSFPRLPVRFIVPAVPLCIVLSGLLWNRLRHRKILVLALLLAIVPYSLLCSCYVGVRFLGDPRMEAQLWVDENLPPGSSIESTPYTPRWSLVGRDDIEEIRSPFLTGRKKIFETIWGDNPWVRRKLYYEGHDEEWYAVDELLARDPDYVAVDSLYFDRFTDEDTIVADYYPSVAVFFRDLLVEDYPYTIVFDRESEDVPTWIYPKEIDFLHNRIVILRKRNPSE